MSARPSPAGSPAPRPPPINLEGIYANIPILINRVRNGQLNANQIPPVSVSAAACAGLQQLDVTSLSSSTPERLPATVARARANIQLRNLLANHAKDIIVFHARLGKPNPLLSLPDVLNPTKKVGNNEAITTETLFLQSVAAGMNQAKNIRADPAFVTAMAAKQAALRNQQVRPPAPAAPAARPPPAQAAATQPAAQVQAAAQPATAGTASPGPGTASPANASPASTPAATPAATPTAAPAAPSPAPPPPRPPAAPSMKVQEVRDLISLTNDARNRRFETEPGLKQRFLSSYTFYQRRSQANAARAAQPASGQASPTTSAPPTPTAQPAPAPAPPAPVRQPSPPKVIPPEPEGPRRKRKLREYMKETAPHLQLELGMDDVSWPGCAMTSN